MGRTYQKNLWTYCNTKIYSFVPSLPFIVAKHCHNRAHHFLWIQAEFYYWELQMMRGCRGKLGDWVLESAGGVNLSRRMSIGTYPSHFTDPTTYDPSPQEKAATINLLTGQFRYDIFLIVLFGSSYFRGRTNYSLCRSMGRVAGIYLFKLCRSFNTLLT